MKETVIIILSLILGILVGIFVDLPINFGDTPITTILLCGILFSVGLSIGSDKETLNSIRHLSPSLLMLPFCTVIGSLIGSLVITLFIPQLSLSTGLAIGSGLGYYSVSSLIIGDYFGPTLAAVGLFANVFRELLSLTTMRFQAKTWGILPGISSGGANTSDVLLPAITSASSDEYAVPAIYNGVVTTIIVPFLVTFFCEIKI